MSADLAAALAAGTLDFEVAPDTIWRTGFRAVPLANVRNAWMSSPELFLDPRIVPLVELKKFAILTQGARSGSGMRFGKWIEERGVASSRHVTSNSLVALVGLTIAAIGISYLPAQCFHGLVERGALRVVETDPPLPPVTCVLMFRDGQSASLSAAIARRARHCSHPIRWT